MQHREKVVARLEEYIDAATSVHVQVGQYQRDWMRRANSGGVAYFGAGPSDEAAFRALPDDTRTLVIELEPSVNRIIEVCEPQLLDAFKETWDFRERADIVRQVISSIGSVSEVEQWLGPEPPAADPTVLHAVVSGPTAVYWDAGQYRDAVDAAARAVNVHLQTALGRRDIENTDLARQAFSTSAPSSGEPRLRFPDSDRANNERTWKSRHQGAMEFAAGLFQAVRNVTAHADPSGDDLSPEYALDCLASFSLLARWVDEAERRDTGD